LADSLFAEIGKGDNGMPWQIKAIGLVGVPSVIAIYLTYALVADFRVSQLSINNNLNAHSFQAQQLIEQNRKIEGLMDAIKNLNQRICVNTSRVQTERNECFR
jgi:hypothetical protein